MITRLLTRETLAVFFTAVLSAIALLLTIPQWSSVFADPGPATAITLTALGGAALAAIVTAATSWIRATLFSGIFFITTLGFWYNVNAEAVPGDLINSWKALASTGLLIPSTNNFLIVPVVITWVAVWLTMLLFDNEAPGALLVAPTVVAHAVSLAYTISQQTPGGFTLFATLFSILAMMAVAAARRPLIDNADEPLTAADAAASLDGDARASSDAEEDDEKANDGGSAEETEPAEVVATPVGPDPWRLSRDRLRLRQLAQAVPIILLIGILGAVAQQVLPERRDEAYDLRERINRPLAILESTTPLAQVKPALLEPEPRTVFTLEVLGLGPDDRINRVPVAELDVYDGSVWSSSAKFEAVGAVLPSPEQLGALGTPGVQQRVELTEAYPFRFLPRVGMITGAQQQAVGWDPRSGAIARLGMGTSDRFFVNDVTLRDLALPADADIQQAPASVTYAEEIPPITTDQLPAFQAFVDEATSGATSELDRLRRVEATLSSEAFGYNIEAPGGHSMAALASYLSPTTAADASSDLAVAEVGRIGFSEQSASAFAVVSRQLGVPSRVVVGYILDVDAELTQENTRAEVTEAMIHAWPEVWVNGVGWFPFEPTNESNDTAEPVARTRAFADETENAEIVRRPGLQEPILIPEQPEAAGELSRTARIILFLAAIPIAYLLIVIGARRIRRWRRRSGSTADQVSGAWREARDRLWELGVPTPMSASVLDVAETFDETDRPTIADPLYDLAPLVDAALFSPIEPHQSEATAAWSAADDAARAAASEAGPSARMKAVVNPRTVLRR